jgi:hypothetical protein
MKMLSFDSEHVSSVLQSIGGSLGILEYSLQDLLSDEAPDRNAEKRIAALSKTIGKCAVEALEFAKEMDPNAGPWLWGWGAAADRRRRDRRSRRRLTD